MITVVVVTVLGSQCMEHLFLQLVSTVHVAVVNLPPRHPGMDSEGRAWVWTRAREQIEIHAAL